MNISLADTTFTHLRDYIYERSGIYISDTKKYLIETRVARILQENKFNNFEDYFQFIKYGSNGKDISRLLDAVTTNETYFFREMEQFNVLTFGIVPKLLEQKKDLKNVKIWSAACSTGEEPYTISMMLMEKLKRPEYFEIYASDISERALSSAKEAVYSSYSVRNTPDPYLIKYFSTSEQSYALDFSVKKNVRFMNVNLMDENKTRAFRGMDVIFCRNVLIYFDNKAKQKAVANLYNSLNPGGYLFVGTSESLHNVTRAFRPNIMNKVVAYQKL